MHNFNIYGGYRYPVQNIFRVVWPYHHFYA